MWIYLLTCVNSTKFLINIRRAFQGTCHTIPYPQFRKRWEQKGIWPSLQLTFPSGGSKMKDVRNSFLRSAWQFQLSKLLSKKNQLNKLRSTKKNTWKAYKWFYRWRIMNIIANRIALVELLTHQNRQLILSDIYDHYSVYTQTC